MDTSSLYSILTLRLNNGNPHGRSLFVKPHSSEESAGRGLFVAGIPTLLQESDLAEIFGVFGDIKQVTPLKDYCTMKASHRYFCCVTHGCHMHKQESHRLQAVLHPKGTSGIVLFTTSDAVTKALAAARRKQVIDYDLPDRPCPTGLKAHIEAHKAKYPGNSKLQAQLDTWIHNFEAEQEKQAARGDDGWTVVTNKAGRKRAKDGTVSGGVAQIVAQEHFKRKKARAPDDFYRFQARQKQQNELTDLQKTFAEAQKQVADMRKQRS